MIKFKILSTHTHLMHSFVCVILPLCELRSLGLWSKASALSASPLSSRSLQQRRRKKRKVSY